MFREEWLEEASRCLGELFIEKGNTLPTVRVTCGWPSHGGRSTKRKVLGECWHGANSEDGVPQIFITPLYSKNEDVLPVLLHELSHVIAGPDAKHKGEFVKIIRAVGLEGPPTATRATPELLERLNALVTANIGAYPHSALKSNDQEKKQTTRLLKAQCPMCDCVIRITQKWVDEAGGTLNCVMPDCEGELEIAE